LVTCHVALLCFLHRLTVRLVFPQDAKTLDFLYYFDYLRAYPHNYSDMTKAFGPQNGK